jgi:hypothetical protein
MFIILSWQIIGMAKRYKFYARGLVYEDKSVFDFLYGNILGLIMCISILVAIIFQLIEIV